MAGTAGLFRNSANQHRSFLARLWTGLLLLACMAPASAQDWSYRIRPGDTIWDLSGEYLKPGITWHKLQEYNQIANPYQLPPGSTILIPLAWLQLQPAMARVVATNGVATVDLPGQASGTPIAKDMTLGIGAVLHTAKDATLSLEFADGSRLLLLGESELHLDRMSRYGRSGMVDTRLRLQRGRITNTIKPTRGNSPAFIVDTPNATSAVRGTRFRIDAKDTGTRAEVVEGSVAVNAGLKHALVKKGYGTLVAVGQTTAIRVAPLLPAPDVSGLPKKINGAHVSLQWPATPGASKHRLQVSTTEQFDTLVVDVESTQAHATLPLLADGDYFLRLRAVDAQGIEGHDALAHFVTETLPEPPFAIAPQAGSIVRQPQPEFRWASTTDSASYRFQLADNPAFDQPLVSLVRPDATPLRLQEQLAPGQYYWRIAGNDATGRQGPYSDPLPFALQPLADAGQIDKAAGDAREVTFRWRAGEPGQRYRFQLSRTADFSNPRVDQVVEQAQITLPRLRSGTWYLRAQSIASDGYESPFPPAQSVQIPCRACQVLVASGALLILMAL